MNCTVLRGTNVLPMPETIFLEMVLILIVQDRLSSIWTPIQFDTGTFFIGAPLIAIVAALSKVLSLCPDHISINSVLDLLIVSLFTISHSQTLTRSWLRFSSTCILDISQRHRTTAFTLPLSILNVQLSVALSKAVTVEWRRRNPDWWLQIELCSVT